MIRRFHVLIACAMLLAGCGKSESSAPSASTTQPNSSAGGIKIGFIVKEPSEPWFQIERRFAQQAAQKYGFQLVELDATTGERVIAVIDSLAAQGAKGFVICTPDVRLGPAIVAKAQSAGLKVLTVDDQFVGPDGKFMTDVPHLGISARNIGRMVGKSLYDEFKRRNWDASQTAVCVVTHEQVETQRERTDGAIESLGEAGFPKDRIFKTAQKAEDIPAAFEAAASLLARQQDVKNWLICGMNDTAVIGAVRAMEGRGFSADTMCGIGINGTDCLGEFRAPQPTGFYASVLLTPRRHGYETAEMMYKWIAQGVEPPKVTYTDGILITRQTYESIMKEQGLLQ
jgi:L-arabinose transport system substrate-binding protein